MRTLGRFHGYEGHQGREEPPFDRMRNAFPGKVPRLENLQASQHCPNVIPTDESRFLGPVLTPYRCRGQLQAIASLQRIGMRKGGGESPRGFIGKDFFPA